MTKPKNTWYLLYKQWLCKYYKAYEGYIEFDTMQKAQKDKKASFTKELEENADLYKPCISSF